MILEDIKKIKFSRLQPIEQDVLSILDGCEIINGTRDDNDIYYIKNNIRYFRYNKLNSILSYDYYHVNEYIFKVKYNYSYSYTNELIKQLFSKYFNIYVKIAVTSDINIFRI